MSFLTDLGISETSIERIQSEARVVAVRDDGSVIVEGNPTAAPALSDHERVAVTWLNKRWDRAGRDYVSKGGARTYHGCVARRTSDGYEIEVDGWRDAVVMRVTFFELANGGARIERENRRAA